jgi:hypothetical protein
LKTYATCFAGVGISDSDLFGVLGIGFTLFHCKLKRFRKTIKDLGDFMSRRNLRSYLLSAGAVSALVLGVTGYAVAQQAQVTICHATGSSTNPYNEITTADPSVIGAHIPNHGGDFIVTSPGQCPTGGTGPTAVPEPITMLLFGAGLAGVGYAKRRMGRKDEQ